MIKNFLMSFIKSLSVFRIVLLLLIIYYLIQLPILPYDLSLEALLNAFIFTLVFIANVLNFPNRLPNWLRWILLLPCVAFMTNLFWMVFWHDAMAGLITKINHIPFIYDIMILRFSAFVFLILFLPSYKKIIYIILASFWGIVLLFNSLKSLLSMTNKISESSRLFVEEQQGFEYELELLLFLIFAILFYKILYHKNFFKKD